MARPIILLLPLAASFAGPASAAAVDEDAAIAANLAAMLRAGRAVVSANQDRINDPAKGQDGLDGPGFLAHVMAQFKQATGKDPADIDPATAAPYGLNFPLVTVRDMVRAQKRLVEHLGIDKLLAVVGGSMGGMQTLQWAASYPDSVRAV